MIRNRSISGIFSAASESRTEDMPTANNKKPSGITPRWQVLFGVLVTVILVYILLVFSSPGPLGEHKPPKEMAHEQLTIVMNTFKRNDMMLDAIKFYSTCPVVKHIYITWSEKQPPPPRITARFTNRQHPTVTFRQEPEDSLNNRFHPISGPHNDAIFSVDDDMRVPCEDLDLAYEVWRGSPRSIVGYMPRIHLRRKNGKLEYRCWWRVWWHGLYSIILTKAAILHHDYFELYSQPHHAMVRNLVDRRRNCEDIAMQFLVANTTMLPPIYVKGHVDDLGVLGGISTSQNVAQAGHMRDRSSCLNDLERIYHSMPLVASHMIVDTANNGWTNAPANLYEYLSSDLWKW